MNGANNHLTSWVMEKFIIAAPQEAAKALEAVATHEAVLLLKPLKAEYIITCTNLMDPVKAAAILRRLPSRQTAYVLARLDVKQAACIYQAFSVPHREKIKTLLDVAFIQAMEQSTGWPAESAGALMNREFVSFKTETKVAEIIEKLKTLPRRKLPLACVIVSKEGVCKGLIPTAELAFFSASSMAGSVMGHVGTVLASQPVEQARLLFQQGQPLVPVVEEKGLVLGVLSEADLSHTLKPKKRFLWFCCF